MHKSRRVCIALITNDSDNILMGRRNDNGKWTNVGGHAEIKEDPYQSMIREVKEETGLDTQDIKLIGSRWDKDKNLILYLFKVVVDPMQEMDTSKDPDKEVDSWHYMNPNDIVDELHVPLEDNIALKYWMQN